MYRDLTPGEAVDRKADSDLYPAYSTVRRYVYIGWSGAAVKVKSSCIVCFLRDGQSSFLHLWYSLKGSYKVQK